MENNMFLLLVKICIEFLQLKEIIINQQAISI